MGSSRVCVCASGARTHQRREFRGWFNWAIYAFFENRLDRNRRNTTEIKLHNALEPAKRVGVSACVGEWLPSNCFDRAQRFTDGSATKTLSGPVVCVGWYKRPTFHPKTFGERWPIEAATASRVKLLAKHSGIFCFVYFFPSKEHGKRLLGNA